MDALINRVKDSKCIQFIQIETSRVNLWSYNSLLEIYKFNYVSRYYYYFFKKSNGISQIADDNQSYYK